jgi:hypothetical protein
MEETVEFLGTHTSTESWVWSDRKAKLTNAEERGVREASRQRKLSDQMVFPLQFHQAFRQELALLLPRLFQKLIEKAILLNSSCGSSITLIPKPDRDKQ